MENILGEKLPEGDLSSLIFKGGRNKYRSAFLRANGHYFREFAALARAAVDSVDPNIRLGICACSSTWDFDGVSAAELSHILAGKTKPFLRLIGAPYWFAKFISNCGNRVAEVIELERMESSWCDKEIEIFSEGDTYPRPRHRDPASYLEIFDSALRADGNMNGILKYAFCYTNHADYERGYVNAHIRDEKDLKGIENVFAGLSDTGVRVYETMRKIEDSDYSNDTLNVDLIRYQFFSRAVRFLSHNSIPAAHRGLGCAGIAFGENARALDMSALEKPLIIDEHAARILMGKGIDVGIKSIGNRFKPVAEHYILTDEFENVTDYGHKPSFASNMELKNGAILLSEWIEPEGNRLPASFSYKNENGNVFLVLAMDAFTCSDEIYKNYSRQKQMFDFLEDCGVVLPAKCSGNPDLYVICKQNEDTLAVGLFNCFADSISNFNVELPSGYNSAEFFRSTGKLIGNELQIEHLGAFDWCYMVLRK
jgi:hypothetical protein